jgi:arsenate reductase (glutaredoxin)
MLSLYFCLVAKENPTVKVVKFYEYNQCSTCKKALKFLVNSQRAVERHPIFTEPPTKDELRKMVKVYGGNFKKLFNTAGHVYQEQKLAPQVAKMSEAEAIDLLASEGRLIKRPFVLFDDTGVVGFQPDEWKKLFR